MIKREKTIVNEIRNEAVPVPLPPPPLPPPQPSSTNAIDISSTGEILVANFFWTIIDEKKFPNLSIPYIVRKNDVKYLSVRIIERSILTKYENNYSEEVMRFGSLNSELCTQSDVVLLNEINDYHVNKEYGQEPFTLQDTLVQLDDFLKFYEILSRTCKTKDECSRINSIRNNTLENKVISQTPAGIQQKQDQSRLNVPDFVFDANISPKSNFISSNTHQNNNMIIPQNQQQQRSNYTHREHLNLMQQQKQQTHNTIYDQTVISPHSSHPQHVSNQINNYNRLNIEQNNVLASKLTLTSRPDLSQQYSNNLNHTRHLSPNHHNVNHNPFISSLIHQPQKQQSPNMDYSLRDISPSNSINHGNMMQRVHQSNHSPYMNSNLNGNNTINQNILPRMPEQQPNRHLQDGQYIGMRQNLNMNHSKPSPPITISHQPASLPPPSNVWPNHQHDQAEIFYNNNSVERNHKSASPAYLVNENFNNRYSRISGNTVTSPLSQSVVPQSMIANAGLTPPSSQYSISPNFSPQCNNQSNSHPSLQKQIYHNKAINQNHNIINALNTVSYPNQQSSSLHNRPISLTAQALKPNQYQNRNAPSTVTCNLTALASSIAPNQMNNNLISNNSPHSVLNSPTPPLTPTPNNFLLSNLPAISPLSSNSQHQLTRNISTNPYLNHTINQNDFNNQALERSARSSVESNISNHNQLVADKLRKQHSSSINSSSNEQDNDDCIILDEPAEVPIPRRVSNSTSMSSTDTNNSNNEYVFSGFLQLNDIIVPYIRLPSRSYRCCSQYQPSNTFIPWKTLAATGLIPKGNEIKLLSEFESIYTLERCKNPNEFRRMFELVESLNPHYQVDKEKMILINLLDLFSHCREAIFLKQHKPGQLIIFNYKEILAMTGGIVLIDVPDGPRDLLIFPFVNYSNMVLAPLNTFTNYVKHFNPSKVDYSIDTLNNETFTATFQEVQTIRQFLNLLLFYLTDNERKCKLPPTIKLINIKPWLTKHPNEFKILCRYSSNFPSDWIENIDRVLINFKLFTRSLNNNSETNSVKTSTQTSQPAKTLSTTSLTTAATTIQPEPTNQIETISLSPSSMDSVTPSVSPFSSLNPILTSNTIVSINNQTQQNVSVQEKEKISRSIVSAEISPKKTLNQVELEATNSSVSNDVLLADLDSETMVNVVCITNSADELPSTLMSIDDQNKFINQVDFNSTDEILNHSNNNIELGLNLDDNITTKRRTESHNAIDNREPEYEHINETITASEIIITSLNFENIENSSIETESTESINDNVNKTIKKTSEEHIINLNQFNGSITENNKTIVFDFDDDNHMTSYEIFKSKRRLSDSVVLYDVHSAFYQKYSDEEPNLIKKGVYDKQLDNKLDEFTNLNSANNEHRISNTNNLKNEPASPLMNIDIDEQETSISQVNNDMIAKEQENSVGNRLIKRNNSSSSSIVSKRKKYSLNNCFNNDGFETISDSDSLSSIDNKKTKESIPKIDIKSPIKSSARKSTTFKPIKNWVNECDIYTTEEFDESFYLKKFNIQDCCVVLENVTSENCLPVKKQQSVLSNDSIYYTIENNELTKNIKNDLDEINQFKSGIRITSSASFAETSSTSQTNTISSNNANANISSLLQPLNFNQNNIKHIFSNLNVKHKENKQITK